MDNLAGFELFQIRRGLTPITIKSNIAFVKPAPKVKEDFEAWILEKIRAGCKASYVNRIIVAVRLYGKFSGSDWMANVQKIRSHQQSNKQILTDDQIEKFLMVGEGSQYVKHNRKMQVFWTLMAFTGMRTIEASTLTKKDINWASKCIELQNTKTGKIRRIVLYEPIEQALREYVDDLETDLLFPSRDDKNKPIDHHVWGRSFAKRLKLASIEKRTNLTAYSFRHSFGTSMVNKVGIGILCELMGNTPKTAMGYIHLDTAHLREAITKLPLARKHVKRSDLIRQLVEWFKGEIKHVEPVDDYVTIDEKDGYIYYKIEGKVKVKEDAE